MSRRKELLLWLLAVVAIIGLMVGLYALQGSMNKCDTSGDGCTAPYDGQ